MNDQVITLPDDRKIGYAVVGKGKPVIYFHGTASSRLEVLLLKDIAEKASLKIVGIDRPGYGLSTYHPRKHLQDFNKDLNYVADCLGFDHFAILGWSGGGVFALAFLAQYYEIVTKAVVVNTPFLPFDASKAHSFPFSKYLMKVPFIGALAVRQLRRQLLKANGEISVFLGSKQGKQLLQGYSQTDLQLISDPIWARLMYQSMAEGFRQEDGVKAVVEEHMLFLEPYDFSFEKIPMNKLVIWQGEADKTCNINNGRTIAGMIKDSQLEIFKGKGHCVMFEYKEKLANVLLV